VTPKLRFEVLKRDGFTCRYCGRKAPHVSLEVEHVIPAAKCGTDFIGNLVACCYECNIGKGDRALPPALADDIRARGLYRAVVTTSSIHRKSDVSLAEIASTRHESSMLSGGVRLKHLVGQKKGVKKK
jgi:hypothetical protein